MSGRSARGRPFRTLRQWRKRWLPEVLYTYSFPTAGVEPPSGGSILLQPATSQSLEEFRRRYPRQLSKQKLQLMQSRLSDQLLCWLMVTTEGTPVGYCHASLSDTLNERINHRVKVPRGSAYLFDDFVVPQYRGRGAHTQSIAWRLGLLRSRGVTSALTTITAGNVPSVLAYTKFGARRRSILFALRSRSATIEVPLAWTRGVRRARSGHSAASP